jgi:hypothetical protein
VCGGFMAELGCYGHGQRGRHAGIGPRRRPSGEMREGREEGMSGS